MFGDGLYNIVREREQGMKTLRDDIFSYVTEKYGSEIEYLWERYPTYGVFRRNDNRKWYGIVMNVSKRKLGLNSDDCLDIMNVKINDVAYLDYLTTQNGFFPAYHMGKSSWVSVSLDGSVPLSAIYPLIDMSYDAVAPTIKKKREKKQK